MNIFGVTVCINVNITVFHHVDLNIWLVNLHNKTSTDKSYLLAKSDTHLLIDSGL